MAQQEPAPGRPRRLSRRAFLRIAAFTGIGAALVALERASQPMGLGNLLRWTIREQASRIFAAPAVVGLAHCPSYADALDALREAWRSAEMPDVAGKRVLVKPNLIDFIEGHPVTTAAEMVAAVVDLLAELGAGEIAVGDGSGFRREAAPIVEASGIAAVLARRKLSFVDLNYDDPGPAPARDGWFRRERHLWLPRHVRQADLIVSVPKLKTHHWAGVTLSLKNLFGLIPGARYGWPKNILHVNGIAPSVLGIYRSAPRVVAVVDGVVGMEGDGPLFGSAAPHGLLAVGADPVAVDALCARLMGFALAEIDHLNLAALTGIGQTDEVEVRGASEQALQRRYRRPPQG